MYTNSKGEVKYGEWQGGKRISFKSKDDYFKAKQEWEKKNPLPVIDIPNALKSKKNDDAVLE